MISAPLVSFSGVRVSLQVMTMQETDRGAAALCALWDGWLWCSAGMVRLPPHLIRHPQPGHRLALADVLVENGRHVGFGHAFVPDAVRVDDHGGTHLAGAQAVRGGHDDLADQV